MFRCFFLGPDGHFVGAKEVEAPEKHAAIEEARKVLRAGEVRRATGFELWRGAEMVFSSAPKHPPSSPRSPSRASGPDRSEAGASRQAAPEVVEIGEGWNENPMMPYSAVVTFATVFVTKPDWPTKDGGPYDDFPARNAGVAMSYSGGVGPSNSASR